jgi:gamma-glutamylcyclotransferase (GGCT)/AIG2-like uncharacterized protein YtfP
MLAKTPTSNTTKFQTLADFCEVVRNSNWFTDDVTELNSFENHLVFFYGTFKIGHSRNKVLTAGGAVFQNYGFTDRDDLILKYTHQGQFPAVFTEGSTEHRGRIFGEIWKVPTILMPRIDAIENNGSYYERVYEDILVPDPRERTHSTLVGPCFMYLGNEEKLRKGTAWHTVACRQSVNYGRYYNYTKKVRLNGHIRDIEVP